MDAETDRRRRLIAAYNQRVASHYAYYADLYRANFLKPPGWRRWLAPYPQSWVLDKIDNFQTLASVHALAARLLMGMDA